MKVLIIINTLGYGLGMFLLGMYMIITIRFDEVVSFKDWMIVTVITGVNLYSIIYNLISKKEV